MFTGYITKFLLPFSQSNGVKFTIIYCGVVKCKGYSSRKITPYIYDNPFPHYAVNCIAEIKDNNGEWVNIGWVVMPYNGGHGVRATQYGDKIHLYVGDIYIHSYSNGANEKYLYTPGGIYGQTSAECRIKVWSIGKLKK